MKIGLLGYGTIAGEHARALEAAGCGLVAVAGRSPASADAFAARARRRRVAESASALVAADDVDAVVIASPNALHAEQALLALQHGKHVLCEVPLALSLGGRRAGRAGCRSSERRFMVCQTQRFLAAARRVPQRGDRLAAIRHVVVRLVLDRTSERRHHRQRRGAGPTIWSGTTARTRSTRRSGCSAAASRRLRARRRRERRRHAAGRRRRPALALGRARHDRPLVHRATASTDFLVHCDEQLPLRERRPQLERRHARGLRRGSALADAVRNQDAAFVDAVATGRSAAPGPADLAALYGVLSE